jgi:hypothetical protein
MEKFVFSFTHRRLICPGLSSYEEHFPQRFKTSTGGALSAAVKKRTLDRGISGSGTNGHQRYRSPAVHVFECGARTRRADCPSEFTG